MVTGSHWYCPSQDIIWQEKRSHGDRCHVVQWERIHIIQRHHYADHSLRILMNPDISLSFITKVSGPEIFMNHQAGFQDTLR